jgi:hypothetical protein
MLKRVARSIRQRHRSAKLHDAIGETIDPAKKRIRIGQAVGTDTDQCKRTVGWRERIQFIETGGITQVFLTRGAKGACAASPAQPGHANALPDAETARALAQRAPPGRRFRARK